jgi:hypothetical protein
MTIPMISLDLIPALDGAAALFGTLAQTPGSNDDRIVEIMVLLYETFPPAALV